MPTEVVLAVAGGRKTQQIAERVARTATNGSDRCLVLTFTTNGQRELESRITSVGETLKAPEVAGWYSFLINHIVRPYLPAVFGGVRITGLHFVESSKDIPKRAGGASWYLDASGRAYSNRLGILANKVLKETSNAPIRRLTGIYDSILIDEIQDLGGNDLEVLDRLMRSEIDVCLVGDVRQSVLSTSRSDKKHTQYKYASMSEWFRRQESMGLCKIIESNTTWRSNPKIAEFSDLIHDSQLNFFSTESLNSEVTDHDGVFVLSESELDVYVELYSPTILRNDARRSSPAGSEVFTFKACKGITRDRVVILATDPIVKLLTKDKSLAQTSACAMYVAVTRARSSVAIVVPDASKVMASLAPRMNGRVQHWSYSSNAALF